MELEASLETLAPGLIRYCVALTRAPELGEEVAQEALAALVGFWRRRGPPDSPAVFVYTVARRVARRALWRRRLLRPLSALGEPAVREGGSEDVLHWREELELAWAAIKSLPAHEREALLLVAAAELDIEAAAAVLGISRSAVKMRVHRARRRLERALGRKDGEGHPARARRVAAR